MPPRLEQSRSRRSLWIALVVALSAPIAAVAWGLREIDRAGPHTQEVRIEVKPGSSLRAALQSASAAGALRHPRLLELYSRALHPARRVTAGRYALAPALSPRALLAQLEAGRVILESLTVIEGSRYSDLRRLLARHPDVAQTLAGIGDEGIMSRLGLAGVHPEGRFFPDTYKFAAGTSDLELLRSAAERMRVELDAAWRARTADLPLGSADQLLTLASIVEKESAREDERERIAGVFVSRLRSGMKLQTDPTVIYGLGDAYFGDIRRRDLETDTPYNTYTRAGLTPTPIALPGASALRAAAQPRITGELYFVATGEPDGSHRFARTY
ncbi:MAG: endolytic transglycosylase MltG [Gammaproteobacteria bacterium]